MHLSVDADRAGIIAAVQQSMPRWYSNCGSLNWYGFADSISESAQMSGLCNMAFEHLLNSRLICFYATNLIHSWRSQAFDTTYNENSLMVESLNSPCTPRMAFIRHALRKILSFRLQNFMAIWREDVACALYGGPPRMAYIRLTLRRILSLRLQNVIAAWQTGMAETPDSPSDSEDSVSSDVSLCDEYPCTCICGSQAVANTLSLANAQLAAVIDTLRLYDEAEALVSN